jgi:hypothetical protein
MGGYGSLGEYARATSSGAALTFPTEKPPEPLEIFGASVGVLVSTQVWLRRSAIRPVPRYARVSRNVVLAVEASLAKADDRAQRAAAEARERLRTQQPALADYLRVHWPESLDGRALGLGQRLSVGVLMAFDMFSGAALGVATPDCLAAADAALAADEQLRQEEPADALDSEDIVGIEQPALVAFVNAQIDRTFQEHAHSIDVDHVAIVFRTILVAILALSHSVSPPPGYPEGHGEEPDGLS